MQTSEPSIHELRSLYVKAKRANANVSLNLLWALESALTGQAWQEVAKVHRTSLLLAVESYERNVP
jgi:DNA transformation protein